LDTIGIEPIIKNVDRVLKLHRLGVGGILPKNVAGNFNKRTLTTSDKLLEQLIGKKKAKAHLAAKQQAERSGAQPPPKHGRRDVPKKEESDDEEEGRAATFKSKRRKVAKPTQAPVSDEEDRPEEDAPETTVPDEPSKDAEQHEKPKEDVPSENNNETNEPVPAAPKPRSIPSRGRAKPTSYLDELLAERSKKKKNKIKNMGTGEN
jgi:hypothetical protein